MTRSRTLLALSLSAFLVVLSACGGAGGGDGGSGSVTGGRSTGGSRGQAEPLAKVLVVGMDGLEWRIVRDLLQQDRVPNLRALMERGTWGKLATFRPTLSPVLWTSMATGKRPQYHGIHNFLDETGEVYTSGRRAVPALWNLAHDHGLTSNVFGWWLTWPVEEVDGMMVSGTSSGALVNANWKPALLPDASRQVHPASLEDEVLELVAALGTRERAEQVAQERVFGTIPPDALGIVEKQLLIPETMWSIQADDTYAQVALKYLAERPADLNMVYFGGTDVSGHRFWRYYEPEIFDWPDKPEADRIARAKLAPFFPDHSFQSLRDLLASPAGDVMLAEVILNYYVWIDEVLGQLLEAMGDDVTVLVVSDHGMHASATNLPNAQFITGHHQDGAPGVIIAAGPGIKQQGDVEAFVTTGAIGSRGSLLNVAPTVLALLGIAPDEEMARHGAYKPMLTEAALSLAALPPVESYDEGFRPTDGTEHVSAEMNRAFVEKFAALGYIGADGTVNFEQAAVVELVNPDTFEADTEFSVPDDDPPPAPVDPSDPDHDAPEPSEPLPVGSGEADPDGEG